MASIGVPAAMRPITGISSAFTSTGIAWGCGSTRPPCTTSGENPPPPNASGRRTISIARARCARRRIKPRSSSAVISRWMPDLERKSSASFISSNEGGTPSFFKRSLINVSRSSCLRVSISDSKPKNNTNSHVKFYKCSCFVSTAGGFVTKSEQTRQKHLSGAVHHWVAEPVRR